MLTIIHGDDIVSSRNYFISLKKDNSLTFDAENLSLIELAQSLQGEELFGGSKYIFIDNLFTRKAAKNFNGIIEILNSKTEADVYIWSDKILGSKVLSELPKHTSQVFKIPQTIWAFLDGMRPGSSQNVLAFRQTLKSAEPEIVFAMIIRQFRLMLGLAEVSKQNIDEVKRLAPWQKSKLSQQTSLFGIEKLKELYKKLYKIEKSVKTGKSNLTLVQQIDIFLLEI